MKKSDRLVLINWIDPYSNGGWHDREAETRAARERDLTCQTVGWIIDESKEHILLASSVGTGKGADGQVGDVFHIPKSVIPPNGIVELVPHVESKPTIRKMANGTGRRRVS